MSYDNLCKYLAETYPDRFAAWLLGEAIASPVEVLKTELTIEPIRADSVTFLRTQTRILHVEFQVKVPTDKPMPRRSTTQAACQCRCYPLEWRGF